ncbi:MAG: reverse transcriptase/maturase family protein [Candidatus Pacebacteria bacterium]|nr:reverse transcriptase/maturase family protein [Candidatus Paceibacterota bacterium]
MTIFTFEKLYKAYKDCIKTKKNTTNALKFEMNREKNLSRLLYDLQKGRYEISRHICFIVTEPSPREIFAGDFRDRIVHHLLCNEIQYLFEHNFIDSSYANRKGKGTHKAVKELKYHLVRGGKDRQKFYFLKMDIKGFFRNIDKNILWNIVEKKIQENSGDENWKKEVLWLARKIIFHDPASNYIFKGKEETKKLIPREKSLLFGDRNTGLPIGNLTSQFFANIYLNGLDHFVKDKIGFERYIRYVDDFIILDEDREELEEATNEVGRFLNHSLKLNLCESKTILQVVERGIDFLGYFIRPSYTLVRRKVMGRFKKNISVYQRNNREQESFCACVNSYFGHFIHANSFGLRKVIWERKFKEMKIFEVGDGFEKVMIKKDD